MPRDTRVGKIPWRSKWQPTTALLLGGSHGQRGYSPWSCKGSDTIEHTHVHGLRVWVPLAGLTQRNCFIMATISKYLLYSWMKGVWNICSINDNEWRNEWEGLELCEVFLSFLSNISPSSRSHGINIHPKVDFGPKLTIWIQVTLSESQILQYDGKLFLFNITRVMIFICIPQ